jgi:DUF4097 and DUF4098 domain-containing protein YvlB
MNDEKMKILKMLENGVISAEEAVKLLTAVGDKKENRENRENRREQTQNTHEAHDGEDGDWISGLKNIAKDVAETVSDAIKDADNEDWFGFWPFGLKTVPVREHLVACVGGRQIHTLTVEGFNAPISVIPADPQRNGADSIGFEINAGARGSVKDKSFGISVEGGEMRVVYDAKSFKYVGMRISVPRGLTLGALAVKTRNAHISVNGVSAESVQAVTKNAKIEISDSEAADFTAETKNAKIVINGIGGGGRRECTVKADTRNAGITVKLSDEERALGLRAVTSNSKVTVDVKGLDYTTDKKNCVEAKTPGYEQAPHKLDLDLTATNAKIQVK